MRSASTSNNRANFSRDRANSMLPAVREQPRGAPPPALMTAARRAATGAKRAACSRPWNAWQKPQEMGLLAEEICTAAIDVSGRHAAPPSCSGTPPSSRASCAAQRAPAALPPRWPPRESLTGMDLHALEGDHAPGGLLRGRAWPLLGRRGGVRPHPGLGGASSPVGHKDRDVVGAIGGGRREARG